MQEQKRVRVDTGPLGAGSRIVDSGARVWPWYVAGTLMLAAAVGVGASDLGARAVATPTVAAARGQALARMTAPLPLAVIVDCARDTSTNAGLGAPSEASAQALHDTAEAAREGDALTARSLNSLGFAARKRGDHASARTLYREAMAVDATHVWSRYNLACELALEGDQAGALALLDAIEKLGGADADDALSGHAPKDADLRGLRGHARFRALTRRR